MNVKAANSLPSSSSPSCQPISCFSSSLTPVWSTKNLQCNVCLSQQPCQHSAKSSLLAAERIAHMPTIPSALLGTDMFMQLTQCRQDIAAHRCTAQPFWRTGCRWTAAVPACVQKCAACRTASQLPFRWTGQHMGGKTTGHRQICLRQPRLSGTASCQCLGAGGRHAPRVE